MKKIVIGIWLAATGLVWASPITFSYQGVLNSVSASGVVTPAPSGLKNVEVRLYKGVADDEVLWGRVLPTVIENGQFSLFFSDVAGTPLAGVSNTLRQAYALAPGGFYVGLTPVGGSELRPRQTVYSVPYSMAADFAVGSFHVPGSAMVAGAMLLHGKLDTKGQLTSGGSISNAWGFMIQPGGRIGTAANKIIRADNSGILFSGNIQQSTGQGRTATFNGAVIINGTAVFNGMPTLPASFISNTESIPGFPSEIGSWKALRSCEVLVTYWMAAVDGGTRNDTMASININGLVGHAGTFENGLFRYNYNTDFAFLSAWSHSDYVGRHLQRGVLRAILNAGDTIHWGGASRAGSGYWRFMGAKATYFGN